MTTSSKNTKPNKSDSTRKLKLDWNQCQQCKLVIQKSNNEDHVENVCSNIQTVLESLDQPFLCQNYANLTLTEHKGKFFEDHSFKRRILIIILTTIKTIINTVQTSQCLREAGPRESRLNVNVDFLRIGNRHDRISKSS
jgi:hypothetical protein